jgi:cytosine/adenosine deaminase-related metal-dependent hydrolase
MYILKDAYVLTLNSNCDFGQYSILIDGKTIIDMTPSGEISPAEHDKTILQKWIEKHGSYSEIIDCSSKIIMPALVNSCLKSEGVFIKYLMRNRHYESTTGDLFTDFIFNYLYQDSASDELRTDLENIYRYSFSKNLKSGVAMFNELSMRKDMRHLSPISSVQKDTGQRVSVCYPIKQDIKNSEPYNNISPAYYFTDENQMTIYDLSNMTELKANGIDKLFFEVATNKEVSGEFRRMFGKPVVKLLDEYELVDRGTAFINPLYLSYDELKIIADKNASIIICPRDLMNFTNRYFPVDDFISNKIKFSIATGWLGEDIFKEVRIFRNRYRELNISNRALLEAITRNPAEHFFGFYSDGKDYCIETGRTANLAFIDLNDVRFQFYPESTNFNHVCDFIIDNVSAVNFSEVMINGDFKVREGQIIDADEENLLKSASKTREKLYKIARYEEISERQREKKSVEMLDLRSRDEEEIKLFSDTTAGKDSESAHEKKEEFRIKSAMPVFKKKIARVQKNLFDQTESVQITQAEENLEAPLINLLYTELDEVQGVDEEVQISKVTEEKLLKQARTEKKKEPLPENPDSKVSLPKNVKLKFGDD